MTCMFHMTPACLRDEIGNPRPQLEPQMTSVDKCRISCISLDTPDYQISVVGVVGSYSIGGYPRTQCTRVPAHSHLRTDRVARTPVCDVTRASTAMFVLTQIFVLEIPGSRFKTKKCQNRC